MSFRKDGNIVFPFSASTSPEVDDSYTSIQHGDGGGDDGMDARIAALETGMQEVRTTLGRMEPLLARIDERLNHTATKAELAEKPSKTYLWVIVGVLVATVLAATGVGATIAALLK